MSPLNTFFVSPTHLHITQTLLLLPPLYLPKLETPLMLSAFHRSLPLHLAEALKESSVSLIAVHSSAINTGQTVGRKWLKNTFCLLNHGPHVAGEAAYVEAIGLLCQTPTLFGAGYIFLGCACNVAHQTDTNTKVGNLRRFS